MTSNQAFISAPLKGEMLMLMTERHPDINAEWVETITTIKYINTKIHRQCFREIEKFNISEGKLYVLLFLHNTELLGESPPSPSVIADNLGVTRATITGLLDGLERDKYVERRHDCADRRMQTVRLLPNAHEIFNHMAKTLGANNTPVATALTTEEHQELMRLLAKIEAAIDQTDNGKE